MPGTLAKALDKLHIRRSSVSSSAHNASPPSTPQHASRVGRSSIDGNQSRVGSGSYPSGPGSGTGMGIRGPRDGEYVPPVPPVPPKDQLPTESQVRSRSGSQSNGSSYPQQQGQGNTTAGSATGLDNSTNSNIPRSQGRHTLPTIPHTPAGLEDDNSYEDLGRNIDRDHHHHHHHQSVTDDSAPPQLPPLSGLGSQSQGLGMGVGYDEDQSTGVRSSRSPQVPSTHNHGLVDHGHQGLSHGSHGTPHYLQSLNLARDNSSANSELAKEISKGHDYTSPQQLLPLTLPTSLIPSRDQSIQSYELVGFDAMSTTRGTGGGSSRSGSIMGKHNPAYDSSLVYSRGHLPVTQDDHVAHITKHLAMLPATIFGNAGVKSGRGVSGIHGRGGGAENVNAGPVTLGLGKVGKTRLEKFGPVVSAGERDYTLEQQRTDLLTKIASGDIQVSRRDQPSSSSSTSGLTKKMALIGQDGTPTVDQRTKEVFELIGWKDRLGIMDTVDVKTIVLEPIVQEHVQPIEVLVYHFHIFRQVHKYHIYPYVQPIQDPNPIILPTRHLIPDSNGVYHEVFGDAAAEEILGRKLVRDGSDGSKVSFERWIESVDGIAYSRNEEMRSVEVGKRAWVERVGQRPVKVEQLGERWEHHAQPLRFEGVPSSSTTVGKTLDEIRALRSGSGSGSSSHHGGSRHTNYQSPRSALTDVKTSSHPRNTSNSTSSAVKTGSPLSRKVQDENIGRAL